MPDLARRLAALHDLPVTFDPAAPHPPAAGWHVDDHCEPLPGEPPGPAVDGGPFRIAQRLLRDYRFADPRIVRAHYDPDAPLEGRDMLLELRFAIFHTFVGCRVGEVVDTTRTEDGRPVQVWGWPYRTLQGHLEQGEMSWEVWKWADTGAVQFRILAVSRFVGGPNPITNLGVRLVGPRRRERYFAHAGRRMAELTADGLAGRHPAALEAHAR